MIEKLEEKNYYGWDGANGGTLSSEPPSNYDLMRKLNEIIDKVNELDIKLHTVKLFTPTQDKAVKELLNLLEKDNSVGAVLKLGDEK